MYIFAVSAKIIKLQKLAQGFNYGVLCSILNAFFTKYSESAYAHDWTWTFLFWCNLLLLCIKSWNFTVTYYRKLEKKQRIVFPLQVARIQGSAILFFFFRTKGLTSPPKAESTVTNEDNEPQPDKSVEKSGSHSHMIQRIFACKWLLLTKM